MVDFISCIGVLVEQYTKKRVHYSFLRLSSSVCTKPNWWVPSIKVSINEQSLISKVLQKTKTNLVLLPLVVYRVHLVKGTKGKTFLGSQFSSFDKITL